MQENATEEEIVEAACSNAPTAMIVGSLFAPQRVVVVAEKEIQIDLDSLSAEMGILVSFLMIYVLNVEYPVEAASTYTLLQKEIFKIKDTKKFPTKVITFVGKLRKM